jgi:hypothetical protein
MMFEDLETRAAGIAARRAAARRERLAASLEETVARGVRVTEVSEGIVLSGRGLARRLALDPQFRWSMAEASDER